MTLRSLALAWLLAAPALAEVPRWVREEKFLAACERGQSDEVRKGLEAGIDPHCRDKFHQPAVLRAVRGTNRNDALATIEVLRLLQQRGASFDEANDYGTTPVFLTVPIGSGTGQVYRWLIQHGANGHLRDRLGLTVEQRPDFYSHAQLEPDLVFRRLLVEGDLADGKHYGRPAVPQPRTVAMAAAYYGEDSVLRDLVTSASVDLKQVDENGEGVIFYAALSGAQDCLPWLEGEAAQFDAPNKAGETPLMRAAQMGHDYFALRLLRYGVDPDRVDASGQTALMYASRYDRSMTTLNLLAWCDPEREGPGGRTALMMGAEEGNLKVVNAFLFGIESARKETGLHPKVAANLGKIRLDHRDVQGRTALMLACAAGHREVVQALLAAGADRQVVDRSGDTALTLARKSNRSEIVNILEK